MKKVLLLAALLLTVSMAQAAPITFKCTTSEGNTAADLIVDTQSRTILWGRNFKYAIHSITDRYISAYLKHQDEVGGEVLVFDRITGEYLRSGVFIVWSSPEAIRRKEPGELTANEYRGKCTRPLL